MNRDFEKRFFKKRTDSLFFYFHITGDSPFSYFQTESPRLASPTTTTTTTTMEQATATAAAAAAGQGQGQAAGAAAAAAAAVAVAVADAANKDPDAHRVPEDLVLHVMRLMKICLEIGMKAGDLDVDYGADANKVLQPKQRKLLKDLEYCLATKKQFEISIHEMEGAIARTQAASTAFSLKAMDEVLPCAPKKKHAPTKRTHAAAASASANAPPTASANANATPADSAKKQKRADADGAALAGALALADHTTNATSHATGLALALQDTP